MSDAQDSEIQAIRAQAHLLHAYFLGLQLMVSTREDREVMGKWMFQLFRRQHLDKFLSSFDKLGLSDLPDAVACAQYHVLSNNMGGVGVEYMYESDTKAWVRFRYPRWMYHGPTLCGVTEEVSRGFLRGWYAHNGVSLKNPRLAYVCVSEDMTGEFGLCGYFKEYDHDLADDERLQFAKGELPPPFDPAVQPAPPESEWNQIRLEKANRNYAMEYIRNGLCELQTILGRERTLELGSLAARLTGLQYFPETASMIDAQDGDLADATHYLATMLRGMGDEVSIQGNQLQHTGLRIVRGLSDDDRDIVLQCWLQLWTGTMSSQRQLKTLDVEESGEGLTWQLGLA